MPTRYVPLLLLIALISMVRTSVAATVTIDPAITYQTIEGFGGMGIGAIRLKTGAFSQLRTDTVYDAIANEMKIGMIREFLQGSWSKDNPSPMNGFITHVKELNKRNENIRFIITVLSPPGHMKSNGIEAEGGYLKTEYYDDFAQWCVDFLTWVKDETGVEIYALSPQNELKFKEPYGSCIYTTSQFRDMLKVLGPKIKQAGFETKIFGPEHMTYDRQSTLSYIRVVHNDPESYPYIHTIASHGYGGDGTEPNDGGSVAWKYYYDYAKEHNMTVWQTETSGYSHNWEGGYHTTWNSTNPRFRTGAFGLVQFVYGALKYGKISGWIYLGVSGDNNREENVSPSGFVDNLGLTRHFYANKHFYRYVQPGAVQIESESSSDSVLVVAFTHREDRTMSVVLLNRAHTQEQVNLNGSSLPNQFKLFETDSVLSCQHTRDVGINETLTLRPRSIVTLFSEEVTVGAADRSITSRKHMATTNETITIRLFTPNGRCAGTFNDITRNKFSVQKAWRSKALGQGVYYMSMYDKNGALIESNKLVRLP